MTPFLKQIALHYCKSGEDFASLLFVFPSRRAQVFFHKYLSEAVASQLHRPVRVPRMMSVEDFMAALSPYRMADRLSLLMQLYDCYKEECAIAGLSCEELDDFVFWGDVILADFDDVDKYLADPDDLFRNIAQYKSIRDDFADIEDPLQKAALQRFMGLFDTDGKVKARFSCTWDILAPLYHRFNERLRGRSEAYGGALYRSVVSDISARGAEAVLEEAFPGCRKLVFCGLNALCECEKRILGAFDKLSLADFCWDYESPWISDRSNRSSFFMEDNIRRFGRSFPLEADPGGFRPQIEVVSVPSAVGQASLLSQILSEDGVTADEHTAVVLPDESLLEPVLGSIPPSVGKINVTMGCQMASSSFYSLLSDIAAMQLNIRIQGGRASFYHRNLWSVAGNNLFNAVADSASLEILSSLKKGLRHHIDAELLSGTEFLRMIFTPVVNDRESRDPGQLSVIQEYQLSILNHIGRTIASDESLKLSLSLEMDYAMAYVKAVNLLKTKTLDREMPLRVKPATYFRLLDRLLRSGSVPFKGEPLCGLQIMGPLETRALDFDNLVILSVNEAVFPRRSVSSSFIPPLMREGFGLPTYVFQDAVWAYYFYRMIQRPRKVWLVLDSRTEGLKSGEESRYIKQLEYYFKADLKRSSAEVGICSSPVVPDIIKTEEDMAVLKSLVLSASSLKDYLKCPASFYFSCVKGLSPEDEVEENLDGRTIGNCFHNVMQKLYSSRPEGRVTAGYLDSLLKDGGEVRRLVAAEIVAQLRTDGVYGRNVIYSEMIWEYVMATLRRDREKLSETGLDSFAVLAVEESFHASFGGFRFKGRFDRVDSFVPGTVRIVDYKTGKVLKDDTNTDPAAFARIADKIYNSDCKGSDKPLIAFQFFIYDFLAQNDAGKAALFKGKTLYNSVYTTRTIMQEAPLDVPFSQAFHDEMEKGLSALLATMLDPAIPWSRTSDTGSCEMCNFKTICGR